MGTCAQPLGLGAHCDPDPVYDTCDAYITGLVCDPTTSTCVPRQLVPMGMPCMTADGNVLECAAGGKCLPRGPTASYVCTPGTAEGQPCTDPYECSVGHKCFNGVCVPLDPSLCK